MLILREVVAETQRRWAGSLSLVEKQLNAGAVVCEHAHRVANRFTHRERLALAFAGRAMHALHSVELLFSTGHPQDATSAMRTLAELYIDYRWINLTDVDARIKRFAEYIYVSGKRRETARQKVFGAPDPKAIDDIFQKLDTKSLPPGVRSGQDLLAWHEAEYQRVEQNYKKNKGSWSEKNIADRAKDIGEDDLYALVHRAGSEASHATPSGMSALSRGEETGLFHVEYQAIVPEDAFPLMMSSACFALAMTHLVCGMGVSGDAEVVAVAADLGPFTTGWDASP